MTNLSNWAAAFTRAWDEPPSLLTLSVAKRREDWFKVFHLLFLCTRTCLQMVPEGTSSDIMEHVIHRSSRIKPLSFAVVSCPQCCSRDALRFKCKTFKGTLIIYKNRFRGKNTALQSWEFSQIIFFYKKSLWSVWVFLLNLLGKLASTVISRL